MGHIVRGAKQLAAKHKRQIDHLAEQEHPILARIVCDILGDVRQEWVNSVLDDMKGTGPEAREPKRQRIQDEEADESKAICSSNTVLDGVDLPSSPQALRPLTPVDELDSESCMREVSDMLDGRGLIFAA